MKEMKVSLYIHKLIHNIYVHLDEEEIPEAVIGDGGGGGEGGEEKRGEERDQTFTRITNGKIMLQNLNFLNKKKKIKERCKSI